jgi:hypothetical protein
MAKIKRRGGSSGAIRDPGPMRGARFLRGPDGSRDGGAMGPIEVHMELDAEIPDLDNLSPRNPFED